MNIKQLRVLRASVVIIMVTAIAAPCHGEDSTQTDPTYNAAQQAIKKARSLGEQATQSSPEDRAVLWRQAHDVCTEFLAADPQNPRRLLVELQDALLWLSAGELSRQVAEVIGDGQPLIEEARGQLRSAIRQLTAVQPAIEEALRLRNAAPDSDADTDALTADELMSMQKTVNFHLARARQNQGRCYGLDSADRTNSLTVALGAFRRLASLSVADDIVWQSRIEEPVCYRLLGDLKAARERLSKLPDQQPPADILARVRAEQIRLHLASGQVDEALQIASANLATASPDLDFARLQTYSAARQAAAKAGRRSQVSQWERRTLELIKKMQKQYGPFWMRRAETLLASRLTVGASDVDTLQRAAESYYRGGQRATALATYDRAAQQALARGDAQRAFTLASTAAAIEQDAGRHQHALARYQRLASEMSDDPRAAGAHLSAIVNAAELVRRADPNDRSAPLRRYVALMRDHLDRWPDADSADQVRWWTAALYESQRRWSEAIEVYRAVGPGFADYEAARRSAARCYQRWLAVLAVPPGPAKFGQRRIVRKAALTFLEQETLGGDVTLSPELRREVAIAAARIRLQYEDDGFQQAEKLLAAAPDVSSERPPEWTSQAQALLALAAAGQGDVTRAASTLRSITTPPTAEYLLLVDRLLELAARGDAQRAHDLAELALSAVDQLRTAESRRDEPLGEDVDRRLSSLRAAALAAADRTDDAQTAYQELIERYPKSGEFREAQARLLMTNGIGDGAAPDEAVLGKARSAWGDVEQKSRRGSDRWFRARLARAQIELRLGNAAAAAKIIRFTQALYPALGGEKLKAEFLRTMQQCE